MSDYTPTTEEIRNLVTDWVDVGGVVDGPEFDRWLAAHDREVAAKAVEAAQERLVNRDQFSERTLRVLDELAAEYRNPEGSQR